MWVIVTWSHYTPLLQPTKPEETWANTCLFDTGETGEHKDQQCNIRHLKSGFMWVRWVHIQVFVWWFRLVAVSNKCQGSCWCIINFSDASVSFEMCNASLVYSNPSFNYAFGSAIFLDVFTYESTSQNAQKGGCGAVEFKLHVWMLVYIYSVKKRWWVCCWRETTRFLCT